MQVGRGEVKGLDAGLVTARSMKCPKIGLIRIGFYSPLMRYIHIPSNREQSHNFDLTTFWQGSLKILNKYSTSNIDRMFIQSYLVYNNVLKTLIQKCYLYIVRSGNVIFNIHLTFLNVFFREHSKIMFP